MHSIAQPTTASAALPDRGITASLTVEIMTDPDGGQLMLVAATQGNQGDLQVVTVAQALAKVTALREQADRQEALINEYAETVLIPNFLKAFNAELEELDVTTLDGISPKVAAAFQGLIATAPDGTSTIAVPAGQTPAERLATIRTLIQQKQGDA
ncbi:hypothetical protein ACPCSD_24500 [Streptomyces griseoincarnatus]